MDSHTSTGAETTSYLLELPPEIRNRIYLYAVVQEHDIALFVPSANPLEPGLLAASRQIREEALSIFYGDNVFCCTGWVGLSKLMLRCSEDKRQMLGAVQVYAAPLCLFNSRNEVKQLEFCQAHTEIIINQLRLAKIRVSAVRFPFSIYDLTKDTARIEITLDEVHGFGVVEVNGKKRIMRKTGTS